MAQIIKQATRKSDKGRGHRSDKDFMWALQYDSEVEVWRKSFSEFLSMQRTSTRLYLHTFNNFLDYLIDIPKITRNPIEYIHVQYCMEKKFIDYLIDVKKFSYKNQTLHNNLSKIYDFFEWFLLNNCISENFVGKLPILKEGYVNPIVKMSFAAIKGKYTESIRNFLPKRYLDMLEEILVENDFAWSKKLRSEQFIINGENVWSPINTYVILLKLKLPLRTQQIRYLDSGEGDSIIFDYNTWDWCKNKLNPYNQDNVNKGVLRKIVDKDTDKEFVGFYINTNKTKDTQSLKKGYVIPWENREVIKIITDLINWQKKYNPFDRPVKWTEIKDSDLNKKSESALEEIGQNIFLFRDVFNNNLKQPVLYSRILSFWNRLMAELERRVNAQRLLTNEKQLQFIQKWVKNRPVVAMYDLHSLRVSQLTSLYLSGVPYPILSKFIAGHSSIIMTMYYTKFNYSHISEVLNNATKQTILKEQESFNDFIANLEYEQINNYIVTNSSDATKAYYKVISNSHITSDIGICPAGEGKCIEGGESISIGAAEYNKPVENGVKNCIRCRFFITGVPFLLGLTARFNEITVEIQEKTKKYRIAQETYETLYHERYLVEKNGNPFLKWKELEISDSNFNKLSNELDQLIIDWHYAYNLIEQCVLIQKREQDQEYDKSKFALITAGNNEALRVGISECSDFELYDSICQSSVFYQSIQPNIANLKRGNIINKMLINNEITPYFALLSEDDMLQVGNDFAKFLVLKLGKPTMIDVMESKKKLKDFGLEVDDIEKEISILLENKQSHLDNPPKGLLK